MLSSKLLPEMELEETAKKEQILGGLSGLPVLTQVEKLKLNILCKQCLLELTSYLFSNSVH